MIDFSKSGQRFNFVLYGTGRTGSNLLKGLINQLDDTICYPEILNKDYLANEHGLDSNESLKQNNFKNINDLVEMSINRKEYDNYTHVGFKLFLWHAKFVQNMCMDENPILRHLRNNVRIIYNNRTNIVKKTFSRLMATHKKVFYVNPNTEVIADKIHLPFDEIFSTERNDRETRNYLYNEIKPESQNLCLINYEKDLEDMVKVQQTINRLQLFFCPDRQPKQIKNVLSTRRTPLKNNWKEHISNFKELDQSLKQHVAFRDMLNEE